MKKFCLFVSMALVLPLCVPAPASAQQVMRTIEIGQQVTTHILFGSDLTYVDISSPEMIAAKVVDASKNMLAIKARKEFDFTTTISALEANGSMHTFYVKFNPNPSQLLVDIRQGASEVAEVNTQVRPDQGALAYSYPVSEQDAGYVAPSSSSSPSSQPTPRQLGRQQEKERKEREKQERQQQKVQQQAQPTPAQPAPVSGINVTTSQTSNFGRQNAPTIEEVLRKDRGLYHVSDRSYRLEADCINVYAYSDQMYIVLQLKNNSDIGYEAGDAQFTVENKKTSAKTLTTDKSVWPRSSFGTLSCPPGGTTKIGYTIPKLTLQKNEVMRVYIYEKGGNRNLFLTLSDTDINYAVSPL